MDLDFNLHDELLHLQEDSIENYRILNEVNLIGRSRQELEVYLNGTSTGNSRKKTVGTLTN
jgi:hypothetical protein